MKIRDGFVTNSSSTNFLIISKKELTDEYLYKKLGFKQNSTFREKGLELCQNILYSNFFEFDELNYENIKKTFGEKAAIKYQELIKKNYHIHTGSTSSDEDTLTSFFTCDSFEIDKKDFYLNGIECTW